MTDVDVYGFRTSSISPAGTASITRIPTRFS